jgi:hypothetical protein
MEIPVGQSYANMDQSTDSTLNAELGQPLSVLGAVVPLEKGPEDDLFFLTFDDIDGTLYNRPDDPTLVIAPTNLPAAARVGIRTFDEIAASYASILEVDRLMVYTTNGVTAAHVDETYQELRQSLPAIEDINSFLSSNQVAIAQLAIQFCDAAIGSNASPNPNAENVIWTSVIFDQPAATVFSAANRSNFVDPLILRAVGQASSGQQMLSQPTYAMVYDEIAAFQAAGGRPDNLIDRLLAGPSDTRAIAKGVCASVLGSAATLVQ